MIRRILILVVAVAALSVAPCLSADDDVTSGPFADAIAYGQARTVKIYGASIGRVSGFATGLLVSSDGLIITSQGVHLSGYRIRVTLPSGEQKEAKVVRRNESLQLALLQIQAETPEYYELSEGPVVRKGDWVLALSNAFKVADGPEPLSVNMGVASLRTRLDAKRGTQDFDYDGEVLLIDAITSNPGAAGGAIVSADGKLAGMIGKVIESKSTRTRLNYAVPNDLLKQFLDGKITDAAPELAGNATLGIRLFGLSGKRSPAFVDRVMPDSPAAAVELRPDDLIVSVAGQATRTIRDFDAVLKTLKPGVEIELVVKRKNDVMQFKVTPVAEEKDD